MITFGLDQVRRTNLHPDAKIGFLVCMITAFVCCFEHPHCQDNHLDNIMFDVIMTSLLDVIIFDNNTTKHVSYSSEETFVESIISNYIFELLIYLIKYVFQAYYSGTSTVPRLVPGLAPWWDTLPRSSGWCSPAGWVSRHGRWRWRSLVHAPRSTPGVPGQT